MSFEHYLSSAGTKSDSKSLSATLAGVDPIFLEKKLWGSLFEEKKCSDGRTVEVLKDPNDAVKAFGKRWKFSLDALVEAFDVLKIKFDTSIEVQISQFEAIIRAMDDSFKTQLIGAYTTFRQTACEPGSASMLWKMTEQINTSSTDLLKTVLATNKITDPEQTKALLDALAEIKKSIEKQNESDNEESDQ